jgi:uncharacterized protein Yka (UPF0111/DUF47 family)
MKEMIKQLRDTADSLEEVAAKLEAHPDEDKYTDVIDPLTEAVAYIRDAIKMAEKIG